MKNLLPKRYLPLLLACMLMPALAPAQTASLKGIATNKTNGRPAAGDDVVLIALGQGMQETTRTKTDAQGRFTLTGVDDGMHLVRVTHDKVPYFTPVPPGSTAPIQVDVYDSAPKVEGISGEADVLRIQATSDSLEVTELWAISNQSSPPRTQFSARSFEISIPPAAKIATGAAMGPGGAPIQASPVPLDTPGHYAFVFPLRPGETRFQVSYKVPYTGSLSFKPQVSIPTANFAVMIPKSMKFDAASTSPFQPVKDEVDAQVFLAKSVTPSQPLAFTVGGTGQMPADNVANANGNPNAAPGDTATASAGAAAAQGRPGGGLGNPIDTPDPLHKYRWIILAAIVFLFICGIAFAMRPRKSPYDAVESDKDKSDDLSFYKPAVTPVVEPIVVPEVKSSPAVVPVEPLDKPETVIEAKPPVEAPIESETVAPVPIPLTYAHNTPVPVPAVVVPAAEIPAPAPPTPPPPASKAAVLNTLKDELFRLETDRLEGRLGHDDYWQVKNALDVVLRYSLRRED
jgi:hypothetical protein